MDYTDAIIRRLRDRLLRYRSESRIGGRKRPWNRIAQDIADAESVPRAFYDKEDDFDVLGEALRRFAAATQVPTVERLDAITAFLTEKGYLTREEMEEVEPPVQAILALAQFFGSHDGPNPQAFCGEFFAARHSANGRNEYRLLTLAMNGNTGMQAEETAHLTAARARTNDPRELRRFFKVAATATIKSDGWLVPVDPRQFLMLVKDRTTGEAELRTLVRAEPDGAVRSLYTLQQKGFTPGARRMVLGRPDEGPTATMQDLLADWFAGHAWQYDRQEGSA